MNHEIKFMNDEVWEGISEWLGFELTSESEKDDNHSEMEREQRGTDRNFRHMSGS